MSSLRPLAPALSASHNLVAAGRAGGVPEYAVENAERVYDVHLESDIRCGSSDGNT